MATSGIQTWELTEAQIVASAYRKLGYLAEGQTLSTEALANGVEALNGVVTMFQTRGMPLWKRTTTVVAPSATSQVYTLAAGVKVAQVVLLTTGNQGSQYDLIEKSLYDFNRLPNNSGPATPVHYTVQPTLASTVVSIWPQLSDTGTIASKSIAIVYQKKFDGFFSATDTIDFPSYWTIPLILGTAVQLAPEVGYPIQDQQNIRAQLKEALEMVDGYGDEDGSLYVQPDKYYSRS